MNIIKLFGRTPERFISWKEFVTRVNLYNDIVNIHNKTLERLRGELE
jgi:hypothetical protein